ncbi:MAG: AAA family ATPase [Bacteroidales bacterium]|nr:AAA family ATPase [Bacteroidales bacterium]
MTTNSMIGRKEEQRIFQNYLESPKAEMVAVYGRRRVGKTFLIKSFFKNEFDFAFSGMYNTSKAVQLAQFQTCLEKYSGNPQKRFKDWFEALDALRAYLETLNKKRLIVFLDEIPWMDTPKSNFLAAFSQFWNDWASMKNNFKLFVCGSATTWMLSKFIGDRGGLYGRVSRAIWLRPFNLAETEQFLKDIKGIQMSRYQTLKAYMVFGGIPYYLDMLEKKLPLETNIDKLFFAANAPLLHEFDFLFRTLFNESAIHKKTVEVLATKLKGMTRQEILSALKIKNGGSLTEVLENLIKCDFIRKYTAIGKTEREAIYQLTDLFSLFYLRFSTDNSGRDESFFSNNTGKGTLTAWSGYAFEIACLHHIAQIKKALSIGGVISSCHSWSCRPFTDKNGTHWKGGQIDLLIDRSDDVINICEIKYSNDEYEITADYEEKLRRRATLFENTTNTKKALHHTFITVYGVMQNVHSGIVQSQVKAEELFSM